MEGLSFTCPVCGADVPRRALSCPDCGACEKSGWSKDQYLDGLNLPGDDFANFGVRQLGGPTKKTPAQRFWLIVTVMIVIAMAWLTLRGLW